MTFFRSFRAACVLVGASLFSFQAAADPPKITVATDGTTVVKVGLNTITVKADGSFAVKGPTVDLQFGPSGPAPVDPVNPVDPAKPDAIIDTIGTIYGALQDEKKAEKALTLSNIWLKAVGMVDQSDTLGKVNTSIKAIQTLKDEDLFSIRQYIRDRIAEELGTKLDAPLDKLKARALFTRIAAGLEKAAKSTGMEGGK